MTAAPPRHHRPAAARGRPAPWLGGWLVIAVFLLQLFAVTLHDDHELAAKSQHCVACALHATPHAAPPDTVLPVAPLRWTLLYALAPAQPPRRLAHSADYLRPPPHAPPSFLLQ